MSVINVTFRAPGKQNPFLDRASQRSNGDTLQKLIQEIVRPIISGAGLPARQGNSGVGSREVASIEYATDAAKAVVTAASVAGSDTVTLNGQALTATQHRATGTVTFASAANNDTITVNGVVFTAKTSAPSAASNQFLVGVSDTADAAAFVALLNAVLPASSGVYGLIKGRSASDVATLYAVTGGTAGNAYTLASSNGSRLAVSAGTLANGAAVANNQFDYLGTNTTTARALADCINNSTTASISQHVKGSCRRAIITCASVAVGDYVDIDSTRLRAVAEATDAGGARIASMPDDIWCQGDSDTNDAVSLVNCINNHPKLRNKFHASNSSGVVTVYERWPEATVAPPIASSNGSRLAITGSATLFEDAAGCFIQAKEPGYGGNSKTVVTSNGTRLAITLDSSGRLTGGASATITV